MKDPNKKLIIPENTNLNDLQLSKPAAENIDDDMTPMQKAILNEPVLKKILDGIDPIDFEEEASKGKVGLLRREMLQTNDQSKKDQLEKQIKAYAPDEDGQHVLVVQKALNKANESGSGLVMCNSMPYVYNGRYWDSLDMPVLLAFLEQVAEKSGIPWLKARQHKVKDKLLKQFASTASFIEPISSHEEIKINVQNGTFCLSYTGQGEGGELRKTNKEDFFKYQLPFPYNPTATAPLFIKYLNQVLPDEDAQKVLMEYIAYIFTFKMKLEKTLFLYGPGANGKSVFFEIITALLGEENVSHYSMDRLLDATGYYRAKIVNKLLNFAPEMGSLKDIQLFKKLTSGEPVDARLPYGEPFTITNYGKFIFNTNELPQVEQTEAFFRRPLIVPFEQIIPESERDINLAKKIIDSELSGIFNIVLASLKTLINQRAFTKSSLIDGQLLKYKKESNTVEQFLENERWIKSSTNKISLRDFYPQYSQYCRDMGHGSVNSQKFSARLRNLGYKVERGTKGYYYVWCEKEIEDGYMDMTVIKSIIL